MEYIIVLINKRATLIGYCAPWGVTTHDPALAVRFPDRSSASKAIWVNVAHWSNRAWAAYSVEPAPPRS